MVELKLSRRGAPERIQRILDEHRAIADAISTGDSVGADLAMRYHIHCARKRVTDHLRDR